MSNKDYGNVFLNLKKGDSFYGENGASGYRSEDGSGSFYDNNGSWGFFDSDGSASYHGADGSWGYKNSDGTGVYYGKNGDVAYYNALEESDEIEELSNDFYGFCNKHTTYTPSVSKNSISTDKSCVSKIAKTGMVFGAVVGLGAALVSLFGRRKK